MMNALHFLFFSIYKNISSNAAIIIQFEIYV